MGFGFRGFRGFGNIHAHLGVLSVQDLRGFGFYECDTRSSHRRRQGPQTLNPKPKPENPVRLEDLGSGCSHKNPTPFKDVVLKESVTRSSRKVGYFWDYHRRALGGSRLVFSERRRCYPKKGHYTRDPSSYRTIAESG